MLKAFKGLMGSSNSTSGTEGDSQEPDDGRFAAVMRRDSKLMHRERAAKKASQSSTTAVPAPTTAVPAPHNGAGAASSATVYSSDQSAAFNPHSYPGASSLTQQLENPNFRFDERYRLTKHLATGSTGKCYICERRAEHSKPRSERQQYCVKVMKRQAKLVSPSKRAQLDDSLQNEITTLRKLRHPSIVRLVDLDDHSDPARIYIVMELMKGGELFDFLCDRGALSEVEAAGIAAQVADCVAYCHAQGVVHRDLKPENLLLTNIPNLAKSSDDAVIASRIEVKVADFGFAKTILEANTHSVLGTPGYVAPEILLGGTEGHGKPVDIWSLGVIIYVLLFGFMPFEELESGPGRRPTTEALLRTYNFRFDGEDAKQWTGVSTAAKDLLWHMLRIDPSQRLTAAEVCDHPWIRLGRPAHEGGSGDAAAAAGAVDVLPSVHVMRERASGRTGNSGRVGGSGQVGDARGNGSSLATAYDSSGELTSCSPPTTGVIGGPGLPPPPPAASPIGRSPARDPNIGRNPRSKRHSIVLNATPISTPSKGQHDGSNGASTATNAGIDAVSAVEERLLASSREPGPGQAASASVRADIDAALGALAARECGSGASEASGEIQLVMGTTSCNAGSCTRRGFDPEDTDQSNGDTVRVRALREKGLLLVVADGHGRDACACSRAAAGVLSHVLPVRRAMCQRQQRRQRQQRHHALSQSGNDSSTTAAGVRVVLGGTEADNEKLAAAQSGSDAAAAEAHVAAFDDVDCALHSATTIETGWSGACIVSALLLPSGSSAILEIAHTGNCRAVLGRFAEGSESGQLRAVALSADHTALRSDERYRVEERGARVLTMAQLEGLAMPDEDTEDGAEEEANPEQQLKAHLELMDMGADQDSAAAPAAAEARATAKIKRLSHVNALQLETSGDAPRVWAPLSDYPGSVFTRSLGDKRSKGLGIAACPEVTRTELCARDRVLVLGTDGLFAFLTSQQIVDIAAACATPAEASKAVVDAAYAEWLHYEVRTDHITAAVVFLESTQSVATGAGASPVTSLSLGSASATGTVERPTLRDGQESSNASAVSSPRWAMRSLQIVTPPSALSTREADGASLCPLDVHVLEHEGVRLDGDGETIIVFPLHVAIRGDGTGRSWRSKPKGVRHFDVLHGTLVRSLERVRDAGMPSALEAFDGDGTLSALLSQASSGAYTPRAGQAHQWQQRRRVAAEQMQKFVDELLTRCGAAAAHTRTGALWKHVETFFECDRQAST